MNEDKCSTTTRGHSASAQNASDKLIHDQRFQHLGTSSFPTASYAGFYAQAALTVYGDPIYSSHLFASLAANNANVRFQPPIPMTQQPYANPHPYHQYHQGHVFHQPMAATVPGYASIPGATVPSQAQIDISSSFNEWARNNDLKETSTTNRSVTINNKICSSLKSERNNNVDINYNTNLTKQKQSVNGIGDLLVTKTNQRTKYDHSIEAILSSDNELSAKKGEFGSDVPLLTNIHESITKPHIFPLDKSLIGSTPIDLIQSASTKPDRLTANINSSRKKCPPSIKNKNEHHNGVSQNGNQTRALSRVKRDKRFKCPTCNRGFYYRSDVIKHLRSHTGEKPYECTICMTRFTRSSSLKNHMMLHTGERPYKCTYCPLKFVTGDNFRRHLSVHTGERPYACEYCPKRFASRSHLKTHRRVHTGEKPYFCTGCGGQYRRRGHKCVKNASNKGIVVYLPSFPPYSKPPQLTPRNGADSIGVSGDWSVGGKQEQRCLETGRTVVWESVPTSAVPTINPSTDFVFQGQTEPEDLSIHGGTVRSWNYKGSSSSVAESSTNPRKSFLI